MLLEKGPEALSDAALLAILLRTGRQGKNAIALAREMISRFGGLNGLMMATQDDLLSVKGIGKAKVAQILAAMKVSKQQMHRPLG
jgi:DNA repair protein RadC